MRVRQHTPCGWQFRDACWDLEQAKAGTKPMIAPAVLTLVQHSDFFLFL
jgi:hypothetical protein